MYRQCTSGTYHLEFKLYAGSPEFIMKDSSSAYQYYWTGSENDGSLHSNSCNGWTSNASSDSGNQGDPFTNPYVRPRTILNYNSVACNNPKRLLCVCF